MASSSGLSEIADCGLKGILAELFASAGFSGFEAVFAATAVGFDGGAAVCLTGLCAPAASCSCDDPRFANRQPMIPTTASTQTAPTAAPKRTLKRGFGRSRTRINVVPPVGTPDKPACRGWTPLDAAPPAEAVAGFLPDRGEPTIPRTCTGIGGADETAAGTGLEATAAACADALAGIEFN